MPSRTDLGVSESDLAVALADEALPLAGSLLLETLPSREAWLARRKTFLGGSDVAAVLGKSPWATPWEVWARKTGRIPEPEPTPAMRAGVALEPLVADLYAEAEGVTYEQLKPYTIIIGPEPFFCGTPDRLLVSEPRGLECKTARTDDGWTEESDGLPENYLLQVHYYMALSRLPRWDCAALIGNREYRSYVVEYDASMSGDLLDVLADWWRTHIVRDQEPSSDGLAGDKYARYLAQRWPRHVGPMVRANAEQDALIEDYKSLRFLAEMAKEAKDDAAAKLKAAIGDATGIEGAAGCVTWKANKDSRGLDYKTGYGVMKRELLRLSNSTFVNALEAPLWATTPGKRQLRIKENSKEE